jgi:hypothetical protein
MKADLKIVEVICWSCKEPMKLAFYDNTMPVSRFTDKLLTLAREQGVLIENTYSKTADESYNANICPHCKSMFGDWFLPDYWYEKPIYSIEVEIDDDLDGSLDSQK